MLKLLELSGFNIDFVEDLRRYLVKLGKFEKYAPVLKNSVVNAAVLLFAGSFSAANQPTI